MLRRYLSKKYDSISDLQSDNGKSYYDSEYDDTPYFIRDLYKRKKKLWILPNSNHFY